LEEQVRDWAKEYHDVLIVTGPILEENLSTIGPNKVSVPKFYYKVILDDFSSTPKGIGFIIPNEKSNNSLEIYAVSIDEVEKVTGLDFFYKIPDEQEDNIEGKVNLNEWNFKSGYSYNSKKVTPSDKIMENNTSQCKGLTKKGDRCLNKTKDPSGYCFLHKKQH
jgi:endonuclease G